MSLVRFLASQEPLLAALDFPFYLPQPLPGGVDWKEYILCFGSRFASGEEFREFCLRRTGGRELKRRVEAEARVPFSAYNLRLYRQTYYGVRHVLAPLLERNLLYVPLLMPECRRRITALEACPACWLKKHGLYQSYKGVSPDAQACRERILFFLEQNQGIRFSLREQRDRILFNAPGDALDSLLALVCAWDSRDRLKQASERDAEGLIAY